MQTRNSTDAGAFAPEAERKIGRVIHLIAQTLAIVGGLVLVGLILLTVLSVSGRALLSVGLGPIPGDFELVEAGTAFAVFSFLPWCQLQRGHVTVDILVQNFGPKVMAGLSLITNSILAVIAAIIFWRLILGMLDKQQYGETTFILQFPIWWSYLASGLGAFIFFLVSLYTVWRSANEVSGGGEKLAGPAIH